MIGFAKLAFKDFKMTKLGQGSQGHTYLGTLIATNDQYAIKKEEYLDEEDKQRLNEKIEQMKRLESRFTVKLLGTFIRDDEIFLVKELCSKGDLRKVISDLQKLPEKERVLQVWAILGQIIRSLDHLHSNSVVHRNIKPENIFVMEDGSVRLDDFCLAKVISSHDNMMMAGTNVYMASEFWLLKKTDYLSDIFSVGIVTTELLTGRSTFEAGTEQATIDRIKAGKPDQLPDFVPRGMKELITAMLSHDADERPSTKQIMEHDTIRVCLKMQEQKENNLNEIALIKSQLAIQQSPVTQSTVEQVRKVEKKEEKQDDKKLHRYKEKDKKKDNYKKQEEIQNVSQQQVFTPVESEALEDVEISENTYTNKNENSCMILLNPVINRGIVKIEVLGVKNLQDVGIADESVRYGRNEYPEIRGWDQIVNYSCNGDIQHIDGYPIWGNSNFRINGSRIGMELNMESNPRTLTFFIDDEEQPNYVTNIPNAVRIWCYMDDQLASFKTAKFEFLTKPTAKHGGESYAYEYGTEWDH
ncbi:MAG: putative NEK protein kinase [Streblomastix strix]|uniref:non-specific serine/threonine protein kinase n=1 Tax=Streblomastix strix TaxID=222440 RepID=A0A5J4X0Y2_9EUKA|nr:MAG: putative NEK protein kinase [Streblomastix strix]